MLVTIKVDTENNILSYEVEKIEYDERGMSGFCNYSNFNKQKIETFVNDCIEDYNDCAEE